MQLAFDQGDLIWLDFSPQAGHEQRGRRAAVVVSNDDFNRIQNYTAVCPITTTYLDGPTHVRLDDRTKITGTILVEQVRSLDIQSRNPQFIERVPEDIIADVLDIVIGIFESVP